MNIIQGHPASIWKYIVFHESFPKPGHQWHFALIKFYSKSVLRMLQTRNQAFWYSSCPKFASIGFQMCILFHRSSTGLFLNLRSSKRMLYTHTHVHTHIHIGNNWMQVSPGPFPLSLFPPCFTSLAFWFPSAALGQASFAIFILSCQLCQLPDFNRLITIIWGLWQATKEICCVLPVGFQQK